MSPTPPKKLRLLGRLVALAAAVRPKVSSTIIVPDEATDDFAFGVVRYTGPGDPPAAAATRETGREYVPLSVKPGDDVYYAQKARSRILRYGGEDLTIIEEDDILGVVGEEVRTPRRSDPEAHP